MLLKEVYRILDTIRSNKRGCRIWPLRKWNTGYGQVHLKGHRYESGVHRLALERKLGRPLRPGFQALHTCDCRLCCNPKHLYDGNTCEQL
jgi:hypothetical protein